MGEIWQHLHEETIDVCHTTSHNPPFERYLLDSMHNTIPLEVIPKPKYVRRSTREKNDQAPTASPGKRLKATAKVAKSGKKKLPAQGLETLSEIALSEAEQMKIATKISKIDFHSSYASSLGANEGTGVSSGVPDVPTYRSKDEQISWKSNEEDDDDEVCMSKDDDDNVDDEDDDNADDDQDDDNEQTESNNDDNDFVHPKLSTFDEEERHKEKFDEEKRVLFKGFIHLLILNPLMMKHIMKDVNVNLERRDTEMTDALLANVQATQVIEDTHVIITVVTLEVQQQSSSVSSSFISNMLNPNLDTGIDSILNLNTESTSLDRVKALEDDFLEFKQTNLFAEAVSSISVRTYYRDEAQAENKDFINKLDENLKKIIKEQVKTQVKEQVSKILLRIKKSVNKQLEAEVLTRSFNKAKTSHAVAANLSELELKKILIDKMENNKSIDRSVQQKTFYKALVDAYETDKDILKTYGDTVKFKRRQDNEDEDKEPSAGSNRGSKRRRAGKEHESSSAPKEKTSKSTGKSKEGSRSHQAEEPTYTIEDLEKPAHQEFNIGFTEDQPVDETTQFPDWFQKPAKPPTPDCDWNKTLPAAHGPIQSWIRNLARKEDPRESFNEPMDTPLDFSTFVLNWLKVDSLTLELLAGPTFELMKGSCKSLVELEYFLKEVYKATTDQLDWNNPNKQLKRIDELHKFSDGTLNDVWSALDDILKRTRMKYLPQTVWRNVDKERAGAMIQAIDQQLLINISGTEDQRVLNKNVIVGDRNMETFGCWKGPYDLSYDPEPEGSTQGYPLVSVEVLRYDTKGEKVRIGNNAD
ncbi:hypothetical protein Tco_0459161 [Tanacetum coccineum]